MLKGKVKACGVIKVSLLMVSNWKPSLNPTSRASSSTPRVNRLFNKVSTFNTLNPDTVSIVTLTSPHAKVAKDVLSKGIHVLVDK